MRWSEDTLRSVEVLDILDVLLGFTYLDILPGFTYLDILPGFTCPKANLFA